ncbi:hypothetical protein ACN28E_47770 [Archangium lansingense]|uniref:hypothetical protein n=1 Tax=Archangium lansingense TaxID=2995310 RepID=UPI003B7CAF03
MISRLAHVVFALVMATGTEEHRKIDPPRAHARASTDCVLDTANSWENQKGRVMNESVKPKSRRPHGNDGPSKVLAAMTGACLIAGCSGVRVLPDGTAACSAEAIAETKRVGIPPHSYFSVEVLGLPGSVGDVALIQEGPIEVRVTGPVHAYVPYEIANSPLCTDHPPNWVVPPECKGKTIVTETALLYGEASLKGDRVQIRLHQLRDLGMIGPFCGVIAQRRSLSMLGLEKNPPEALRMLGVKQPPPGTVAVWSDAEVLIVEDESQKPRL